LRTAITVTSNGGEDLVDGVASAATGTRSHFAVVVDGVSRTLTLYQNDTVVSTPRTIRMTTSLSRINDINNWIGRSQWTPDEDFAGIVHEFRIYSRALPAEQIAADNNAGPEMVANPVDASLAPPPPPRDASVDATGQ
jgi:hypothetical protein